MAAINAVPPRLTFSPGFTLTEMAMVLFIVALLLGSLMLPLGAQDDLRKTQDTTATLQQAHEALLGFAAANGRLPCPATATSQGLEAINADSTCTLFDPADVVPVGYLPAATLGLRPADSAGRLIDGWSNPVRYAVTTANASAFVKANGMTTAGMSHLAPDLIICPTAQAGGNIVQNVGTATAQCPAGMPTLTTSAVAVIYSLGSNGATSGTGTDEQHNPNPHVASATLAADRVFISHERTDTSAANGEFDDMVIWLSPHVLYNRLLAAGRLP